MYYTYVLLCKGKGVQTDLYIGFTSDLKKRIAMHEAGGVRTTKKFDTLKLVYYEACLSKKDAQERELQLKTGFGRGYLKRRIADSLADMV